MKQAFDTGGGRGCFREKEGMRGAALSSRPRLPEFLGGGGGGGKFWGLFSSTRTPPWGANVGWGPSVAPHARARIHASASVDGSSAHIHAST